MTPLEINLWIAKKISPYPETVRHESKRGNTVSFVLHADEYKRRIKNWTGRLHDAQELLLEIPMHLRAQINKITPMRICKVWIKWKEGR